MGPHLPQHLSPFIERANSLRRDERIVGLAAGGSYLTDQLDVYSDLDLIVAVEPGAVAEIMAERRQIAAQLGPLLAAFTGEHVGEPRLLICFYDAQPPCHIDLKFVSLDVVHDRVEDPAILWQREGRLEAALNRSQATYPQPDPQWIEDRFWIWIHYTATKIGRGELFEALDTLSYLRSQVLGPLALLASGARPSGVRRLETQATNYLQDLRRTVADYDRHACVGALSASTALYRRLRENHPKILRRTEAEATALAYLRTIASEID